MPAFVRASGGIRVVFAAIADATRPIRRAESGGYRLRFPRADGGCEAVFINTGGGMAGGDRLAVDIVVEKDAAALLTTPSAERIYRSQGPDSEIAVSIALHARSRLEWLPQETILFSETRLRRTIDVAMPPDALLTVVESVIFGRVARGEIMADGAFRDRWRVRRGGRLVFAEDVRLDGAIDRIMAGKAVADAGRALATVLYVAPDAEARLDAARGLLVGARSECGASAWNGLLIVRFLSREPQALRADLGRFLIGFRGRPLPRCW